jgi:DHA2 family methylenomycin A resistance protein-like MFS transporter
MSVSTPVPGRVESSTAPAPERRHPRAALAAAMLGFFVVALDAQVVNVALPGIRADLGGGLSGLHGLAPPVGS